MFDGYAVFAIIDDVAGQENKILLVQDKNKAEPNFWKLPGGKGDTGEYPELALIRELSEEIGINVYYIMETDRIYKKRFDSHEFLVYKAKYFNGDISIGSEINKAAFFSTEEIKRMLICNQILPKHAIALSRYLLNR